MRTLSRAIAFVASITRSWAANARWAMSSVVIATAISIWTSFTGGLAGDGPAMGATGSPCGRDRMRGPVDLLAL